MCHRGDHSHSEPAGTLTKAGTCDFLVHIRLAAACRFSSAVATIRTRFLPMSSFTAADLRGFARLGLGDPRPREVCHGFACGCVCSECTRLRKLIEAQRARCRCNGEQECNSGKGDGHRIHGCCAWLSGGDVRPLRVRKHPRQPWEPQGTTG